MTSGTNPNMWKTFKKILGPALTVGITLLFLYFAFKDVDLEQALVLISRSSILWLVLFCIVFMFSHFVRALRWKYILNSVKPDTSTTNLFGALMIGYGVNCVVPRLGELYRALFLGRLEKLSRSSMLGTIIIERVIDIIALFSAVLVSVLIFPGDLFTEVQWLKSTIYLGFLAVFGIVIFLLLLIKLREKFYNAIVKLIGKVSLKAADKLAYVFHMLVDGFASLRGKRNYFMTVLLTIVIYLIYAANSYFGFLMLNMDELADVNFQMGWILMTISAFGVVIPTPGGTGSYHAIVIFVLITLFGFGQEISAAYALLTHFISYVLFIGSTIFFIYWINKKQTKNGELKVGFLNVFKITKEDE
ncbi:MAG: flippase-like domain-containing protein [Melioribacteraceae bacterium]|nr:flippase-like domain-containing protein [Melioribacteraceae bacterium]MCF8392588.1 flippase-like domain-containing protein [Melioribacteraceae bacterium]MCF8418540.1 flippase-like domain-containing protein [Melioribacteraceae bacterium]